MSRIVSLLNAFRIKLMSKSQYQEYLKSEGVTIGNGCDIHKSAQFGSEPWLIKIGDNVRITQGVKFITHDGGLWTLRKMGLIDGENVKYGSISVGNNCNISWDVTIMPNVHIGDNCVIAAGAVVTKNVPAGTIWGGVPAKQIETIDTYYKKVSSQCVPTYSMQPKDKKQYLKENKPELFV